MSSVVEANDMRGTHVCASMDKFKISIIIFGVWRGLKVGKSGGGKALKLNQQLIENRAECYLSEKEALHACSIYMTLSNANCFPVKRFVDRTRCDALVIYCLFVKNDFLIYIS